MTVKFVTNRIIFYVAVFLLSGTVLGLAAHFASIFLPHLHPDFTIFAIIIPSLTIFAFLFSLQFGQPRSEAPMLAILWILWLAMAAWSTDVVGPMQCDALTKDLTTPTRTGTITQREYCYEMKVIEAFSWMLFALFTFAFVILLVLVQQAERLGRPDIWYEPIQELGWFHEYPGYYNSSQPQGMVQYHMPYGYPMGGYPAQQGYHGGNNPVYSIQQGPQGPVLTQVPVTQM
ncbi:hypothetical protein FB45DRAFT_413254 [Roridomyces roridus]|uniref:MARVEL domain-containing protein n=1 Tax=Roridomyces roridus TaxID=1738132 RepID=A0AAD7C4K4_9AGAR|nr:hypothetical protein FB45DRAFT_413254 [Roridomyces roridus]